MVLDPIPQSLPVHIFGSRPQPPTSLELFRRNKLFGETKELCDGTSQLDLFRRNKSMFRQTSRVVSSKQVELWWFRRNTFRDTSLNLWRNKFRVETSFVTLVSTCDETSFVTLVSLVFDIYVYIYMYIYIYIYMRYLCHHNSKRLYDETSLISVWYICIYIYVYIHTYMHKILLSSQLEGPLWRSFITLISLEFRSVLRVCCTRLRYFWRHSRGHGSTLSPHVWEWE